MHDDLKILYFNNYAALKIYALHRLDQNDLLAHQTVLDVFSLFAQQPNILKKCSNPRLLLFQTLDNLLGCHTQESTDYRHLSDERLLELLHSDPPVATEQAMAISRILSRHQESKAEAEKGWAELTAKNASGKKKKWWILNSAICLLFVIVIGWLLLAYVNKPLCNSERIETVDLTNRYSSLQDALVADNQKCDFLPTWLPDRYTLDAVQMINSPKSTEYTASYVCDDDELLICVVAYKNVVAMPLQTDGVFEENYTVSGTEYRIYKQGSELIVLWEADSYACMIRSSAAISELKFMIDSIMKKTAA